MVFGFCVQLFATRDLSQYYMHLMAFSAKSPKVLPSDLSAEFPGYACLLGNILEAATLAFARPDCSFDLVTK